jgi:hypothetical protein
MAFQTPEAFPATATFPTGSSFPSPASFPSNYDPDAVAYFAASGVTDPTQRLNISQLFTGLKGLNLWASLVDGYALRSSQNIGSGSSVPSLKGNSTGTLINNPAWTANGITFTSASSQQMDSTIGGSSLQQTFFCVVSIASSQDHGLWRRDFSGGTLTGGDIRATTYRFFTIPFVAAQVTETIPTSTFTTICGTASSGVNPVLYRDGVLKSTAGSSATLIGPGTTLTLARDTALPAFLNGTMAHFFYFNSVLNASSVLSVNTLIKNTVAQGLGLP